MNRVTIAVIVVLAISLLASLYTVKVLYGKYTHEVEQKEEVIMAYGKAMTEVKLYRNAQQRLVSKNEALELDRANLKKMVEGGYMASLRELPGIKKNLRNLQHAYQVVAKVRDSLIVALKDTTKTTITPAGDTTKFVARCDFYKKTKWFELSVLQLSDSIAEVNLETTVPITGAVFWQRKWFLGKKRYWAEATSENPHVVIPELVNVTVKKRR